MVAPEKGTEVAVQPVAEEVSGLVHLAIKEKVPVEVLERLVALQERVTDRHAEMAMAEALNAFQAECPPVPRVGKATVTKSGVKQYEYRFAPYDEILVVIRPHLKNHDLSFTHDSAIIGGEVEMVCTLQHILGATRKSTFRGPVDNSGGKNPLQGVGSARSYGKRYTLADVLGLSTEEDDDGRSAGGNGVSTSTGVITEAQAADLEALIQEVGTDKAKLLAWVGVKSLAEFPASELDRVTRHLEGKRGQDAKE